MIELSKYVISTGEIIGQIWVSNPDDAMLNTFSLMPGQGLFDGSWNGMTHYVLDEQAILRPFITIPQTQTLIVNEDWIVPDIPEGTVVEVDLEEIGTVDSEGLTLSFDMAGIWLVKLRPPFPYLEAHCEVTVT